VVTLFERERVMSTLHIGIPSCLSQGVKEYEDGETVKIKCFLNYCRYDSSVALEAEGMEVISTVKVVAN